jgi:hypothetical protein
MTVEQEFKTELEQKLSNSQVIDLAKKYRRKLYDFRQPNGKPYAPNSINKKLSLMNKAIKESDMYSHLYQDVLEILIPDRNVKKAQILEEKQRIVRRLENVELDIEYEKYIEIINENKDSDDFWQLCCVALMVSGRRNTELFKAKFSLIANDNHHVYVRDVLKKRNEEEKKQKYKIPIIEITPREFIDIINLIRGEEDYEGKTNEYISNKTNRSINANLKEMFHRNDITTEVVRTIYAGIASKLYKPPRMKEVVYMSRVLAHNGLDIETASRNYNHVNIIGLDNVGRIENKEKAKKKLHEVIDKEFSGLGMKK